MSERSERMKVASDALLACPFCGQAPIKFGNESTCECDNKACGIYGVAVEVELWQVRHANSAICLTSAEAQDFAANQPPPAETDRANTEWDKTP